MSKHIVDVTDDSFDTEVVQKHGVVLVDFWADWCGPCKMLAPILADIASEYADEVSVVKVNADQNKATTTRFSVRGLPSILVFVDGVERERLVGTVSKTRLAMLIDQLLEA